MFDYIKGEPTELTPAYVVLETGGVGYCVKYYFTNVFGA